MSLQGFKVIGSEPIFGSATLTVHKDTIKMNKALGQMMQNPKFVQFLLNAETRQLAIRPCDHDAPNCRPFCSMDMAEKQVTRRINAVVSATIRSCMGWSSDQNMSIGGTYLPAEKVMVFDLGAARPVRTYDRKQDTDAE